ncbi:proline racemase [Gautieria morchelliformis]|nr:proline racemase [Gautieria morchelliformis]
MDLFHSLSSGNAYGTKQIRTVGMHTAGEPTRIVIQGFPPLVGDTLLLKRAFAKDNHDHIRKRLMHEPRGHRDMYGAILVQETELVQSGKADIGVIFCHNEGFSTMCGHATLALGRFLVDTYDVAIFPRRAVLSVDTSHRHTMLTLHAPCGPVRVFVPVISTEPSNAIKSDPSRPVCFLSVPSFAVATNLILHIPSAYCWTELLAARSQQVKLDIAFGGAFYAVVSVDALGFPGGQSLDAGLDSGQYSIDDLDRATRLLKAYMTDASEIRKLLRHPTSPDLEYLYGIIVVDPVPPQAAETVNTQNDPCLSEFSSEGSEVGICFFADQQIDRSPCGSGVCARVALAMAKGNRQLEVPKTYHSLVTKRKGEGAFIASAVERLLLDHDNGGWESWVVKVEGSAYYTEAATFIVEEGDKISREGFTLS